MIKMNKKNIVAGLGEIGTPILKLLSENELSIGYDINEDLMNKKKFHKYEKTQTLMLHICIPFSEKFISNVKKLVKKFDPQIVVVHSTVSPRTTSTLQSKLSIPIIYSATRGVHKRKFDKYQPHKNGILFDIMRYTKFFAISDNAPNKIFAIKEFKKSMKTNGVKTKQMSTPETLELGKIICDTSYYGWLINYAQLSNMIATQYNVDYDEMWTFSDEIHKFLGNRPKMFPGIIGGHCIIPNLDLIHNETLNLIKKINTNYEKNFKIKL